MKKILGTILLTVLTLVPVISSAYTSPGKPAGQVNDFAHILNSVDIQTLESDLDSFGIQTGFSVVIVTIPSLGDETVETYATQLFKEWGIGGKEKDTGVLILVAPNDREARIEVGYGVEGALTDLQASQVVTNVMIPEFKKNNYATGIENSVRAVLAILVNSPEAEQYVGTGQTKGSSKFDLAPLFFLGILAVNFLARILGATKSWWLGGVLGAIAGVIVGLIFGLLAGIIGGTILTIIGLIFDYFVSKKPPGSGGGGFWPIFLGGGRGGSSGGGFGGFGGGMSGGGGASGRW